MEKHDGLHNHDTAKDLTRSLYLMNSVQQNLANERENIVNAVSQMTYVSKEFKDCSQRITEKMKDLDSLTQSVISQEIRNVATSITEEVSSKIIDLLNLKTEGLLEKLKNTTDRCERDLGEARKSISYFSKWFLIATFLTALISGVTGGFLVHYSFPKMDKEILAQLNYGSTFKDLWSKLPAKEREKLIAFSTSQSKK